MHRQKAFSLVLLLIEVAFTLLIAGILVPSLFRSSLATKEALAAGSLRTVNIAGISFSYMTENIAFAILGGLVGAVAAFAIHLNAVTPRDTTSTRTNTLQASHRAPRLTGPAETFKRGSASLGHRTDPTRHQMWTVPRPADSRGQSIRWPRGEMYAGR
jgi:hypothetical protein